MLRGRNIWCWIIYIFYTKSYKSSRQRTLKVTDIIFCLECVQGCRTLVLWGPGKSLSFSHLVFRMLLSAHLFRYLMKQTYSMCSEQKQSPCSEILSSHFDLGKCYSLAPLGAQEQDPKTLKVENVPYQWHMGIVRGSRRS